MKNKGKKVIKTIRNTILGLIILTGMFLMVCIIGRIVIDKISGPEEESLVQESDKDKNGDTEQASEYLIDAKPEEKEESVKEVTMTAVGDVLIHKYQMDRFYRAETDSFDFTEMFSYVKDILREKDYTVANMEGPLAGRYKGAGTEYYGYTEFPTFNSPEVIADTLKDVGVDFLNTANNHSMDAYEEGVYATLDYMDQLGLAHTGTARSKEEQDRLCIEEVNGITFGFTSFTYDTNGIPLPADAPYCVNSLKWYQEDAVNEVLERVENLRNAGVDFVIVIAHWGDEYVVKPSQAQEDLENKLFAAGADVIFGSHPHVVQPMEVKKVRDTDGKERTGVCIYSMGNFVSSQTNQKGPDKDLGLIMNVSFKKENDQCFIEAVEVTPTYTFWTSEIIGVVPVEYAINSPEDYPLIDANGWGRIHYAHDKIISVVADEYNVGYNLVDGWYQIILP